MQLLNARLGAKVLAVFAAHGALVGIHVISPIPPDTSAHHRLDPVPLPKSENGDSGNGPIARLCASERTSRPRISARALDVGRERSCHAREPGTHLGGKAIREGNVSPSYLGFWGDAAEIISALMIVRDFTKPSCVSSETRPATNVAAT